MVYPKLSDEQAWAARVAWLEHDRSRNAAAASLGLSIGTFEGHLAVAQERWGLPIPENARRRKTPAPPPLSKPKYQVRADGSVVGPDGKPAGEEPWRYIERERRYAAQQGDLDDGMTLRGVSTMTDDTGATRLEWTKTKPQGRPVEETYQLHEATIASVSTLFDAQGLVSAQWVKQKPSEVAKEAVWQEIAKAMASELPRIAPTPAPQTSNSDLLALFPVGDHHVGLLAWSQETGEDYDLAIAEQLLCGATDYLVAAAPACEQALVVFLGDLLHVDGFANETPTSHNRLDVDSRFPKMVAVAIRSMRYLIQAALAKHGKVHCIVETGNHDISSTVFLAQCLDNIYSDEPRVTIDTSPKHYHYYQFGSCLIGTHHGHGTKMERLPLIMATDQPEMWGLTQHRYWLTGHIHSRKAQDFQGCTVESFRILAPGDAWANQKGYRSIRSMHSLVLHREFGEVARHTVSPDMLAAGADLRYNTHT